MNTNYDLLCWCWRHKQLGTELSSTNGKNIYVIDPGLRNGHNGPTFFNAKIKVDGAIFVGNVQILEHASEWYLKGYDRNLSYQNVILIVCLIADSETLFGRTIIPTIQAEISEKITSNVKLLMQPVTGEILCKAHIMDYAANLTRHAWLAAMQTEFLENRSEEIREIYKETHDWNYTFFVSIMTGYGFGVNDSQMEKLARSIPLSALEHHRDDLFQIEAFILGQANLLNLEVIPDKYQGQALNEGYFAKLRNEYLYLAHKFGMKPISGEWHKFSNGGYGAYPFVLLSMFANFFYMRVTLNCFLEVQTAKEAEELLTTHSTPYWQTHNHFGCVSEKVNKNLSRNRKDLILANAIIPFYFAFGRETGKEYFCDLAFDMMEQIRDLSTPESDKFGKYGFKPDAAGDAVAMTHLQKNYCDKKECLKCRFGFCFIKNH